MDLLAGAGERAGTALATDAVGREELREEPDDARVVGVGLQHLSHARAVGAVAALRPIYHLLWVEPAAIVDDAQPLALQVNYDDDLGHPAVVPR